MASIVDIQTANLILRDGFTLHYRKLQAKKNKREPIRCAKCQYYANHITSECQSQHNICANCAGNIAPAAALRNTRNTASHLIQTTMPAGTGNAQNSNANVNS